MEASQPQSSSGEPQVRRYEIYVVIKQGGDGTNEQLEHVGGGVGSSPQQVLKAWLEEIVRRGDQPPKGEYAVITGRSIWRKTPKVEVAPKISFA